VAKGDPMTSPYVYDTGGDFLGRHLTCSFVFDNVTRVLASALIHRDIGCVYVAVLIGDTRTNPTRVPASGSVPAGDTPVTKGQLNANGFTVIEDVLALQITATA
jgi:hypothetical protein